MCRGWSGHVYKFRSSNGNRSTSWNIKQSHWWSLSASLKPTFNRAARLNAWSAVCSTIKMPYSICCFIKNGWMFLRKMGKWSGRSRYGTTMATRSRAAHSVGLYQPPSNRRPRNRDSIEPIDSSCTSTSMGPIRLGGCVGHTISPNFCIIVLRNGTCPLPPLSFRIGCSATKPLTGTERLKTKYKMNYKKSSKFIKFHFTAMATAYISLCRALIDSTWRVNPCDWSYDRS